MKPYYDQDGITIYHGDCADVLPTIDPADVSLLLTDPPYGMRYDGDMTRRSHNGKVAGRQTSSHRWGVVAGDNEPFDPTPLFRFKRLILWGANFYTDRLPANPCWISWHKRPGDAPNPMNGDVELAWTNLPLQRVYAFDYRWHGASRANPLHPTEKPVDLMRWIIDRWTEPGDLVLDPYMGSGPVAQACHEMGRRYVGVEIVEDYCEIAVQRLAQGVLSFD